jgi:hypothetical protein
MRIADDLFGGPQGSPRTDKLIAASIQWAERIEANASRGKVPRVAASKIRDPTANSKSPFIYIRPKNGKTSKGNVKFF